MFRRKSTGLPIGRLVIVNTKDQRSIVGWLTEAHEDALILSDARILPTKEKILGGAVVPAENVSWIQRDVPAHLIAD